MRIGSFDVMQQSFIAVLSTQEVNGSIWHGFSSQVKYVIPHQKVHASCSLVRYISHILLLFFTLHKVQKWLVLHIIPSQLSWFIRCQPLWLKVCCNCPRVSPAFLRAGWETFILSSSQLCVAECQYNRVRESQMYKSVRNAAWFPEIVLWTEKSSRISKLIDCKKIQGLTCQNQVLKQFLYIDVCENISFTFQGELLYLAHCYCTYWRSRN